MLREWGSPSSPRGACSERYWQQTVPNLGRVSTGRMTEQSGLCYFLCDLGEVTFSLCTSFPSSLSCVWCILSVIFWGQALSLLLMHESFIKISALGHLDWMSRTQIWAVLKEKNASKIVSVYKFTAAAWNKPTGLSDSPLCHELM